MFQKKVSEKRFMKKRSSYLRYCQKEGLFDKVELILATIGINVHRHLRIRHKCRL